MQPFLRILPDVAAVYGCASGDISYRDMALQVAARRDVLAAAGLPVGARIGLYLFNTPDFFVNWLAANALGLSIVPINPDLKRCEAEFILSLIHISEPTRRRGISYAVFCLKKKK